MLGVKLLAVGCWGAISGCVFALLLWMAERGGGW
jgi:hypothetical protein